MTSATVDAVITIDEIGQAKAVKAPTQLSSSQDLQLTLDALASRPQRDQGEVPP